MGDAILRIPRDARVRAYSTRDTYDGVVPATSKRQPYCHSSYIELSAYSITAILFLQLFMPSITSVSATGDKNMMLLFQAANNNAIRLPRIIKHQVIQQSI